jgi:hypothetical protein
LESPDNELGDKRQKYRLCRDEHQRRYQRPVGTLFHEVNDVKEHGVEMSLLAQVPS